MRRSRVQTLGSEREEEQQELFIGGHMEDTGLFYYWG